MINFSSAGAQAVMFLFILLFIYDIPFENIYPFILALYIDPQIHF